MQDDRASTAHPFRVRIWVRRLHLWLGLSTGLLFALLGLTGSALVFYQEIDALLHPAIRVEAAGSPPGWTSPVWDEALKTVRRQWPSTSGQWRFEARDDAGAIAARYYPGGSPHSHMTKRMMVWLSPDGRHVIRHEGWGDYAMSWIYELHMDLLSDEAGHKVVGWSGLLLLVLVVAGLGAWWPKGEWRKATAFKRRAVPVRRLHDIHKLTGLWSLPLLILFAVTGFMLALPKETEWALARTIGTVDAPAFFTSDARPAPTISIHQALAAAHAALPDARLSWIEMPAPGTGVIKIRVQVPGDPSRRFPHSYVFIDPHSGKVLGVTDARKAGAATAIVNWLHPLHDASIGGLGTRILAIIVGLTPAILFITGAMRWQKRRSRKATRHKIQGDNQ